MVKQEPMEFKFEGGELKFDMDWAFNTMSPSAFPSFQARGTSLGMSRLPSTVEIDGERALLSRRAIPADDRGAVGKGTEGAAAKGAGGEKVKGAEGGSSNVSAKDGASKDTSKSSSSKSDASKPRDTDSTSAKSTKSPSSSLQPPPRGGASGGGKTDHDTRLSSMYLESGIGMDEPDDEELEEVEEKGETEEVEEKGDVEESEKEHGEEQTEQEEEEEEEVVVVDDSEHRYQLEQYSHMCEYTFFSMNDIFTNYRSC